MSPLPVTAATKHPQRTSQGINIPCDLPSSHPPRHTAWKMEHRNPRSIRLHFTIRSSLVNSHFPPLTCPLNNNPSSQLPLSKKILQYGSARRHCMKNICAAKPLLSTSWAYLPLTDRNLGNGHLQKMHLHLTSCMHVTHQRQPVSI